MKNPSPVKSRRHGKAFSMLESLMWLLPLSNHQSVMFNIKNDSFGEGSGIAIVNCRYVNSTADKFIDKSRMICGPH